SGEEHLYSDFPEIDLSQLDAGDLDSAGCFSELQWGGEHSETDSSQYSTDDSELFQIIDSENEALLAALTETLDDIQGDDMGLAAFPTMEEGDTLNPATTSPAPSPKPTAPVTGGPPPAPECDELSLLKKLLLSPSPPSCEAQRDGSSRRPGTPKSRPSRPCTKAEGPRDRRASVPQAQSRSCTELHRHLTSSTSCSHTKAPQAPEECPGSGHHPSPGDCAHHEDDSDSSEDSLSSGDSAAALSSAEDGSGSQFSCEGELRSVVELIRYMHTYCLPPRKLPARDPADAEPRPCSSPFKRAKPDCAPSAGSAQSRPGCAWQAAGSCKKPGASFSILKELLARDLLCDVSKPYRLGKPVYAALARPPGSCSPVPPHGDDASGACAPRVKAAAEKGEPRQSPEAEAPREPGGLEDDAGKQEGSPGAGKVARRQDSAVYAVRRSKRLNPELGHWLSFLDEPPPEPSVALGCREAPPCPVLEGFSAEEPAAEVEVGGTAPSAEPQPLCLGSLGDGEVGTESQRCALLEQTGEGAAGCPLCSPSPAVPVLPVPSLPWVRGAGRPRTGVGQHRNGGGRADSCPLFGGGSGLTPPTTPPYKPAEEDLYKPDIPQEPGKEEGMSPSPGGAGDTAASRKAPRKHPERTELFAHLSRAGGRALPEQQGLLKRPFSRSFGDHDYCQVLKPEAALQRKVLKSWEPPSQVETEHKRRVPAAHYQGLELGKDAGAEMLWKDGVKQLRDQEIRASLTKHFGFLDSALDDEDMVFCKTPEYDTVFEDSCSESGSPVEEEEEEDEEEDEEEEEEHGNTKLCLRRNALSRTSLHFCSRSRSSSGSSCCRSRSPASRRAFRCENGEQCQGGSRHRGQLEKRREKAIGEGRVVYIRNLSSSMSSSELKKRFEVFGEIVECQVLSRTNRGEKYGFITYRYSEHAALSLKNGPSLRKRNEPSFQLSSGGLGRFFWTRYADLDCSTDESSPAAVKSKYETMDFDSLLQEAQLSLH
ncbi:PRGC2 protein, partial [Chaetops frenatus]|nr:PRGC2 protein [Chaetops frenatus]